MNRVVTCLFTGAMALALHTGTAWAQEEAPAVESKPVPLADSDPGEILDLLAEGKNGNVLGLVFDVVLDGSGKARTVVVELFEEEPDGDGADEEAAAPEDEPEAAAEGGESDEAEALPEESADEEGTEEPMQVGKLVGVSPEGAMVDVSRDVVVLPSITLDQARELEEFSYEAGMKTAGHPDGYPAE